MNYRILVSDGNFHSSWIGDTPPDLVNPKGQKFRMGMPRKAGDNMALLDEAAQNGPPQKPIAPRDQYPHGNILAARTANTSRLILELWRISTGKAPSQRNVVMFAAWG